MSRILKTITLSLAGVAISGAAYAGCNNGTYCNSNSNNWANSNGSSYTWNSGSTSSYSGVASESYANAQYGSGSISNSYSLDTPQYYGFSGSTSSVTGLGYNESLQATNCPTNVYNPEGGRVMGCYNVVKPVPQTTYYRVVRPVIYVRYPVPVPVVMPSYNSCSSMAHNSGAYNSGHSHHSSHAYATRYGYGAQGHHGYQRTPCG